MELCNTVYSICIVDNTKLGVDTVAMKSVKYIDTGITIVILAHPQFYYSLEESPVYLRTQTSSLSTTGQLDGADAKAL